MTYFETLRNELTAAIAAGNNAQAGQLRWRINCQERLEKGTYKKSGSYIHTPHYDRLEGAVTKEAKHLIADFAGAMLEKMNKNTLKRVAAGLSDAWHEDGWQEDCVRQLQEHIAKGDPLDVAILSAFCWYHGWTVSGADTTDFSWLNLMPVPTVWHELKTDAEMMPALRLKAKTAELRRDDRGFEAGHGLTLRGWTAEGYTGDVLRFPITSIVRGAKYGLMPGFAMLSLGDEVEGRAWRSLGDATREHAKYDAFKVRNEFTDLGTMAGRAAERIVDREQGCTPPADGCQFDALCGSCSNTTPRFVKCDACGQLPCKCGVEPRIDFRVPGQVICPGCDMEVCTCLQQRA